MRKVRIKSQKSKSWEKSSVRAIKKYQKDSWGKLKGIPGGRLENLEVKISRGKDKKDKMNK